MSLSVLVGWRCESLYSWGEPLSHFQRYLKSCCLFLYAAITKEERPRCLRLNLTNATRDPLGLRRPIDRNNALERCSSFDYSQSAKAHG